MNISAWDQKYAHIFAKLPVVHEEEDPPSSDASQTVPAAEAEHHKNEQSNEKMD